MFDLSGRVALVTGAGRGLGRTLALGLAGAGASVAAVSRTIGEVEAVAAEIVADGGTASAHVVDVRAASDIRRMVAEVEGRHGRIDILVNNAGAKVPQDVLDVTEEAWDAVLDTNLRGAFFVAQAVARGMMERGSGKIINVASTYAVVGAVGRATYAASKGGLLQLTRVMALEWAGKGINVNAVGPTSIDTPMNRELFNDEEWRRKAVARIPAGRFAEPEDVVGPVIFLASDASSMVHGHLLLVDGGFTSV
jgi:2-deoxy-D-gluconate 3-dehydrogenase